MASHQYIEHSSFSTGRVCGQIVGGQENVLEIEGGIGVARAGKSGIGECPILKRLNGLSHLHFAMGSVKACVF